MMHIHFETIAMDEAPSPLAGIALEERSPVQTADAAGSSIRVMTSGCVVTVRASFDPVAEEKKSKTVALNRAIRAGYKLPVASTR